MEEVEPEQFDEQKARQHFRRSCQSILSFAPSSRPLRQAWLRLSSRLFGTVLFEMETSEIEKQATDVLENGDAHEDKGIDVWAESTRRLAVDFIVESPTEHLDFAIAWLNEVYSWTTAHHCKQVGTLW